jgi:DNA-binding transcriptional regulator/RsmH inhibitor MraZ
MDPEDASVASFPAEPPNGRYSGKLDDKGRFKLPAVFQAYLAGLPDKGLFVTSVDLITAQIYPIVRWRENLKFLRGQLGENKKHASALLFNAQDLGADTEMDNQGRVTLNSELRQQLKLKAMDSLHLYWEDGHILMLTDAMYQERQKVSRALTEKAMEALQGAGLQ